MSTRRTTAGPIVPPSHGAHKGGAEDARERLLLAGLRLFANQGYANTSTRELAEAASVNIAAISYYFGDKAGLYRAVFFEPMGEVGDLPRFNDPALPLAPALEGFFEHFLQPLRQGDTARLCMKLHFREMLEPTGLGDEALLQGIQPVHDALVGVLVRHLGLAAPDLEVQRLAVAVAGLGVHVHVGRDISEGLAPGLYDGAGAIDAWAAHLVRWAGAMVQAEAARRGIEMTAEEHQP